MKVLYVSKALLVAAYRDKLRRLAGRVDISAVMPERWAAREPEPSPPGVPEPRRVRALLHGRNHLHVYPGASRWLDAEAADLVHIDEEPYSLVTLQLARLCASRGIPFVFFAWQNLDKRLPPPFGALRRRVYGMAAGGIAGTDAAARVLERTGFDGPTAVIPQFGVDPERFRPDPDAGAEVRERHGIPPSAFLVGYAGRLVPEKGVDVLIEAWAALETGGREPWLLVVGDGPAAGKLRGAADASGAGERVRFVGERPSLAMPAYLAALDVLVLPSVGSATWTEQFGRVLIEAMACGVPVVGSRCGEIPDVVGDAGAVVPAGDAGALAAALARLRADPSVAAARAAAGRERVLELFTNDRVAQDTVALYSSLRESRVALGAG